MIAGEIEIVPAGADSMEGRRTNTEEDAGGMRGSRAKEGCLFRKRNFSRGPEAPLRTCDSLGIASAAPSRANDHRSAASDDSDGPRVLPLEEEDAGDGR